MCPSPWHPSRSPPRLASWDFVPHRRQNLPPKSILGAGERQQRRGTFQGSGVHHAHTALLSAAGSRVDNYAWTLISKRRLAKREAPSPEGSLPFCSWGERKREREKKKHTEREREAPSRARDLSSFRMDPFFHTQVGDALYMSRLVNDSSLWNFSLGDWFHNRTADGFLPMRIKVTIVIVYSIVCIVGLVGNCSVMYVIIRFTKMKTATNIYIFNLALADTLCLITLPFQGTDTFMGSWPFGNALCKIAISIDYYNMFTSTFTLTMMSVDRYIAICHPIKALDIRTPHKAKVVNVGIWALASVFGIPVMVMGSTERENEEIDCLIRLPEPEDYWEPIFGICIFLFSFMIPVMVITICYSLMIRRLKNVRVLSGSKEKDRNLRRIARLVLVVVAVFIICWTPVHIFVLVRSLGAKADNELSLSILYFCTALGYANSCLNPVLYAFLDENFKTCFKKFCFPSAFRKELQMSNRMCSIAKDVAYACKNSDGTNNPA